MEFNRTEDDHPAAAGTDGGRHGGPNFATGEDDSQFRDESISQHSNSESGSQSISQEDGSKVPGGSTSESIGRESGCDDDYDGSGADPDDGKDTGIEAAMDLMRRMDNGTEASEAELRNLREMLFNNPRVTRERISYRIKRDRFHELDVCLLDIPVPIAYTEYFNKSIEEWSNLGYLFPQPDTYGAEDQAGISTTSSTWAYDAPMSPSGYTPPPSPWVYPHLVPGFQCASAIKTDWPLPLPTASASPQFSSFIGQPSSSLQPTTSTVPPSLQQQFSHFPSQPSSTAIPPQPSTLTDQTSSTVSASPPSSTFPSQPSSTSSASPPQFAPFTGQLSSTGSPTPSPFPTFPGQPTSADRPSTSRVPLGIGLSYMYASQASKIENLNASQDTTIVSSILSNVCPEGGQAEGEETSPRKKFKGPGAELYASAKGLKDEEKVKTKEEWDEIASQGRMDQKSFQEVLVDLETLLQLYQLSLLMTKCFGVPPSSILETFDMAYRVKQLGRPRDTCEVRRKDKISLAKRLSIELLGIVPRYEDFPVPYMAGIEVPGKWFFNRFKHIGGLDRLRNCYKGSYLPWVTPTRYEDRQKLRFCYVRPEVIAHDFPYDRNRVPQRKDPQVLDLLVGCAGPPYRPLPAKETFIHMNPAVLRNYMIRFENYIPKIHEIEWQQRRRLEMHFKDRFEVTQNLFESFQKNFDDIAGDKYKRSCSGLELRHWNRYFIEQRVNVFRLLQRIVDVAQIGMPLLIKYSDGWIFKIQDMDAMLRHRIPLFDPEIVDERPPQDDQF